MTEDGRRRPALVPLQERDKPGAIPPTAGQGARVHSLLDAGFHRHDELLLGFIQTGYDLHPLSVICHPVFLAWP